jgi:hypothetical protein
MIWTALAVKPLDENRWMLLILEMKSKDAPDCKVYYAFMRSVSKAIAGFGS